ncbi:hypothetical protein F5Y15DRAFT_409229 [Xylariaceae sp. FL0016]|nr:hypothetical protein F5Y15DRAFT_409229 [Xylariaceae sp. FL0016]
MRYNKSRYDFGTVEIGSEYRDSSSVDGSIAGGGLDEQELRRGPAKKPRRWQRFFVYGSAWTLIILGVVILLNSALAAARSLWGIEDDPDKIFGNWGQPGSGTQGLDWYPTDFLRDVVPVPCHSHNDYWRKVPVYSALHAGCVGIEADVWLLKDKGPDLYVGHDTAALSPNRTFQSLYIQPLVGLLERNNPQTEYYNGSDRGIFDVDPSQTVVLLVDLKTDGAETLAHMLEELEPLRARNWLSYVQDGILHKRQITVVSTGNAPFDALVANSTYRDVFYDAPLEDLWEDPDAAESSATTSLEYDDTNSFYASVSLGKAVGFTLLGLSHGQLQTIRGQIKGAHRRGLKVRYWDTPEWPIFSRNAIWHALVEEGADILNVDDLESATKKRW